MIFQKNYDFSFSGLKTAVLYDYKKRPSKIRKSKAYVQKMAKEIQQSIIDVLIYKTLRAAKEYKAKAIILGGGVAANQELRKQFKDRIQKEIPDTKYLIPDTKFCTDNAAMIALTAFFNFKKGKKINLKKIEADANLKI
jgi:N6-L-threonylcarbamoyladenine synthase